MLFVQFLRAMTTLAREFTYIYLFLFSGYDVKQQEIGSAFFTEGLGPPAFNRMFDVSKAMRAVTLLPKLD